MSGEVLVIAELRDKGFARVSFEAASAGGALADSLGTGLNQLLS